MVMIPSLKPDCSGIASSRVSAETENGSSSSDELAMTLVALSHTPVEHQLYQAMRAETSASEVAVGSFSVQRLTRLTGLKSYTTIRRARANLVDKLSIERKKIVGDGSAQPRDAVYHIFNPEEILARRRTAGLRLFPIELSGSAANPSFGRAIERALRHYDLSRREAHVVLCCAEGMTNTEIGEKLFICKQTVKFHLRHIFLKYGVKNRKELISHLLMQGDCE
jgi:DNA-binding CsgD family transcriptional regulator